MIKWAIVALAAGAAFSAGCYVGWKTTLRVVESVASKRHDKNDS